MIEAKKLTKNYGNFTAVRDASFAANKGEVVGLLGPNGAGKTTIMRMLTGYSPPSAGTAIIAGFDVTVDPLDAKAHVGYLPERVPLYPDMTVREYVGYWAEMRGMHNRKKRRARVDEVIETVQLTFKRDKLVRSLSKGMRQRLGLAQALVHNPEVIILDEPTIGIDPAQVIEVRETVRDLGRDHCVLFSTHILTEAEQVCDRLLIINQGRIIAEGAPDALRRQIQSGTGIYVEMSGGEASVLQGVPGVLSVQADGAGYQLQIADEGVREAVFDAVTAAGLKLLEMRSVSMTLEDIFLEVIGEKVP
ncbi:MAG: ABC transporter ATP-binding protein [Chloroflexota bacterium]